MHSKERQGQLEVIVSISTGIAPSLVRERDELRHSPGERTPRSTTRFDGKNRGELGSPLTASAIGRAKSAQGKTTNKACHKGERVLAEVFAPGSHSDNAINAVKSMVAAIQGLA